MTPYSLKQTLSGKNLVVVGGTGFLGKVWLALVLTRFPEIGHIYLVVRPKEGQDVEERFVSRILGSEVFAPLRAQLGVRFDDFIREKVTPMAGDVASPLCGISAALRQRMRGKIAALINVAGIVDFDPPLDEALSVNAFGCQNLVSLARDLGTTRILHTSTCYTAGGRTGRVPEVDPRQFPFPRAGELDLREWSPDREVAECLDVIEQARHRADDAFQKSAFLAQAKKNLAERDEPTRGPALARELAKVKRKYVETQLRALGMERARFWGWPNTYTYTKSIGEQIIASSGLAFTIVRPAIVESTLEFPFPGWNEGINTSAPFIFLIREGGLQVPGSTNNLDMIPCDLVCSAILIATGELIDGSQKPVYQAAASDTNPCTMARFFELSGLYKREFYQRTGRGGPLVSKLQEHFESALLSKQEYEAYGPHFLARSADFLAARFRPLAAGPLAPLAGKTSSGLRSFADDQRRLARVMDTFLPFVAEYHYVFETRNTRESYQRLPEAERALVPFEPAKIDWRRWFLDIHAPTLEKRVFPLMEAKRRRPPRTPERHETLGAMLEDLAERHGLRVCLGQLGPEGRRRLSYKELFTLSQGVASRLSSAGVEERDRVLLIGEGGLPWAVGFFGILLTGAAVVPVPSDISRAELEQILAQSGARAVIADERSLLRHPELQVLRPLPMEKCLEPGSAFPVCAVADTAPAVVSFSHSASGRLGAVVLTHENITQALASLARPVPMGRDDRVMGLSPQSDMSELLLGLLFPLSRGAQVLYPEEFTEEKVLLAFREERPTVLRADAELFASCMRKLVAEASGGRRGRAFFGMRARVARTVRKKIGLEFSALLLASLHERLGGSLRAFISASGVRSPELLEWQGALGVSHYQTLFLPKLGVMGFARQSQRSAKKGALFRPLYGIEVEVRNAAADGVGELWIRGSGLPTEFLGEPQLQLAGRDGWRKTGLFGSLDAEGLVQIAHAAAAPEPQQASSSASGPAARGAARVAPRNRSEDDRPLVN